MNRDTPYRVAGGKVSLVVMNATDGLPAAFALMGTRAEEKVAIRILGGCKGMGPEDKEHMLGFFAEAFDGYRGLVWSGGTRQVKDGRVDPMVTDVPGIIAAGNPGAVALGTVPRTDMLTLQEDSRLVFDQYGTVPNPDMQGILIVQNGADGDAGWDLDVPVYFQMMEHWRKYAGFTALGTIAWNGGDVTENEMLASARRGWPTFIVEGTGRAADKVAAQVRNGEASLNLPEKHQVVVVSKDSPGTLHSLFSEYGFIPA